MIDLTQTCWSMSRLIFRYLYIRSTFLLRDQQKRFCIAIRFTVQENVKGCSLSVSLRSIIESKEVEHFLLCTREHVLDFTVACCGGVIVSYMHHKLHFVIVCGYTHLWVIQTHFAVHSSQCHIIRFLVEIMKSLQKKVWRYLIERTQCMQFLIGWNKRFLRLWEIT